MWCGLSVEFPASFLSLLLAAEGWERQEDLVGWALSRRDAYRASWMRVVAALGRHGEPGGITWRNLGGEKTFPTLHPHILQESPFINRTIYTLL